MGEPADVAIVGWGGRVTLPPLLRWCIMICGLVVVSSSGRGAWFSQDRCGHLRGVWSLVVILSSVVVKCRVILIFHLCRVVVVSM